MLKEAWFPSSDSKSRYTTKAYEEYDKDLHENNVNPDVASGDTIMKDFRGYPLWIGEFLSKDDIPTNACIDDYTVAKLLDAEQSTKWYNARWPVELDKKKMIKAVRMPLGFAAKMWVNEGDIDRNGHTASRAGWYYKWYRGIHILCGEEGVDLYKHRPSHEDALAERWYFDSNFQCHYQDDERGKEETRRVNERIGSRPRGSYHTHQSGDQR